MSKEIKLDVVEGVIFFNIFIQVEPISHFHQKAQRDGLLYLWLWSIVNKPAVDAIVSLISKYSDKYVTTYSNFLFISGQTAYLQKMVWMRMDNFTTIHIHQKYMIKTKLKIVTCISCMIFILIPIFFYICCNEQCPLGKSQSIIFYNEIDLQLCISVW